MATVPPDPGANQINESVQGGGNSFANPAQQSIPNIIGSPEGVIYAPPGWIVTTTVGNMYVKQSTVDLATGWRTVTLT